MKKFALALALCMAITSSPALAEEHEAAAKWADETLAGLSLREKVAQMLTEQMRGEYVAEDAESFRYLSELARDVGIGSFVVYGGAPYETAHLINRLQRLAKIPILFSSDFEGGPGQQFAGASEFPANMALAAIGDERLAYEVGRVGATEGRAIGIHLTYSPVVDVQTRPDNPVLSVRSFGSDVDLLGRMASAYIRGYQENGMLATAKHFPGRGDVDILDDEFLINRKPAARVEAEDLAAFQKAIDAGVTFVMSEHIQIPSVTGGSVLPASAEAQLATTWLRDRLGFEGVLTTDDLWYEKVVERFGAERAGVLAIQAGHDMLLKPANARAMLDAVVAAVERGEISEARIDTSARKVLYWKARLDLHENRYVDPERIPEAVGTRAHRDLVREIAERSVTLVRNDGVFPTSAEQLGTIVLVSLQKNEGDDVPRRAAGKLAEALPIAQSFVLGPNVDPARYRAAAEAARRADTVVVPLFHMRTVYRDHGTLPERDLELLRSLAAADVRTIALSFGNPYLAVEVPELDAFVVGYGEGGFYGNQLVYATAFARLLKGEIEASGKLPVSLEP